MSQAAATESDPKVFDFFESNATGHIGGDPNLTRVGVHHNARYTFYPALRCKCRVWTAANGQKPIGLITQKRL